MAFKEITTASETIFTGKILTVRRDDVQLENGQGATREVIEHRGAVGVLPLFEDGTVGMVRQFRYPIGGELLEIPAGKLDEGEAPIDCAKRELNEETGLVAGRYDYLGYMLPAAAYDTEKVHIFLARDLHQGQAHLDEDEFLSYVTMPFSELIDMAMDGRMTDSKTLIAVLKTAKLLEKQG